MVQRVPLTEELFMEQQTANPLGKLHVAPNLIARAKKLLCIPEIPEIPVDNEPVRRLPWADADAVFISDMAMEPGTWEVRDVG